LLFVANSSVLLIFKKKKNTSPQIKKAALLKRLYSYTALLPFSAQNTVDTQNPTRKNSA